MASSPFVQLAGALIEAMGQRLDAAKPTDEGLVLRTGDGFLYAFLEDPTRVSLETISRLFGEAGPLPAHLVVLTPGHLPLALSEEVVHRGGTLVEGPRFAELARQLGLESMLGEEPRPRAAEARRLLPSAQQLDGIMHRARTWLDWGVPALALRFYRQAAELKPGFLPAKVGIGRGLLALRLVDDAERQFGEVLATRPEDLDARLGLAAVLGARSRPKDEVEMYRALLAEDDARTEVRAHLLAALVDLNDWKGARVELEAMLSRTPEEPQLRFLHAIALERTGEKALGGEEREEARRLGLTYEREAALCQHLGLPPPARAADSAEPAGTVEVPSRAPSPRRRAAKPARRGPSSSPKTTRRAASNPTKSAPNRKRK
jgi:tetratricopeptide (TPR) repeat protein